MDRQTASRPVLILGAGINGCALARELALNGVSVWLVDTADLASGATSGSSRLIHGGLRYLEYGEFDLVKESLGERGRLLKLAPQFVRPLRLWVPAASRFGGAIGAVGRFFGWRWWPSPQAKRGRGVTLIRAGLTLYDAYARDPNLPKHHCVTSDRSPVPIDREHYRWACAYYDAQVEFPERLVISMLEDARQIAAEQGSEFRFFNYHRATLAGETVEISPVSSSQSPEGTNACDSDVIARVTPAVIVNATGAWVDFALRRLEVPSKRLMGGTKGSHLFTFNSRLREMLAGQGIYAEASDGRPIFITPLADTVLIGTTDEPFEGPPEEAVATERELDYLLESVNAILPEARLTRGDIDFHYAAVRPLPYVDARTPAAITRRHALVRHDAPGPPVFSVVGGKLTTMRSLAQETAAAVLAELQVAVRANSEDRPFPGAESYPSGPEELENTWAGIAARTGYGRESVIAVWRLCGSRTETVLASWPERSLLDGTPLPLAMVRRSIAHEAARTLGDLIERRLMLLYHPRLTRTCLMQLAHELATAGHLRREEIESAVAAESSRLQTRFGKKINS